MINQFVSRLIYHRSRSVLLIVSIILSILSIATFLGLNIIPAATNSSATTNSLPTTAATIGITSDKSILDLSADRHATGTNTVIVSTNSVAGYTITQTFDNNNMATATSSKSSSSPTNGTAKWVPSGDLQLDQAGQKSVLPIQVSHSFGDVITDSANGSYSEPNTFTFTLDTSNTKPVPAGTYKAQAKYSLAAKLPSAPSGLKSSPGEYKASQSGKILTVTADGGLLGAYNVYIDNEAQKCVIDSSSITDKRLACAVPSTVGGGKHTIYLQTQASPAAYKAGELNIIEPCYFSTTATAGRGDPIQVDYDCNMIPVKYTGDSVTPQWTVADPTSSNASDWFSYDDAKKQWANVVTVKKDALTKYSTAGNVDKSSQGPAKGYYKSGTIVDNNDVLGYFVYVPRYAYEVQRRDAVDKNVAEQNFDIHFETVKTAKSIPATCSGSSDTTHNDYRTTCATNNTSCRTYHGVAANASGVYNQTTWATHPAFTWGNTELNGFWVGKFETTGKISAPTVKPNQVANVNNTIGEQFTSAASIGVDDLIADTMGSSVSGITKNGHNLLFAASHMLKNSEWGAAAYLSASSYGAGVNNVRNNDGYAVNDREMDRGGDGNFNQSTGGITGCGPHDKNSDEDFNSYEYTNGAPLTGDGTGSTTYSSIAACSPDKQHAYNQSLGVLASTTSNVYGIYDMAGGSYEYVMGNRTASIGQNTSDAKYLAKAIKSPYLDTYSSLDGFGTMTEWDAEGYPGEYLFNNDVCTWSSCGGQALHETRTVQAFNYDALDIDSWGMDSSYFVDEASPWFTRGGQATVGEYAGVFSSDSYSGEGKSDVGFRIAVTVPKR